MTAIAGASAGVKDMADGSLRITIEFEPKDAKNAFELFGSRGTPVALAALKVGFQAVSDAPKEPPAKIGPLCREAVELCKLPEFQRWIAEDDAAENEADAKAWILKTCGVGSRKDLDTISGAGSAFIDGVRIPFMRFQRSQKQGA
jgi:hypothetical protein